MRASWGARGLLFAGSASLVAFFAVLHARTTEIPYEPFGTARFPWTFFFLAVYLVAAYSVGLPDLPKARSAAVAASVGAAVAALATVSFVQLLLGAALLPRLVVAGSSATMLFWSILCWRVQTDVDESSAERVFVIAEAAQVAELRAELISGAERRVEVVGTILPSANEARNPFLIEHVEAVAADLIVLDVAAQASQEIISQVAELHRSGIRVRTVSLFSEEFLGKIPVADMERTSLLFDIGELHRALYVRSKRVLDVVFGVAALPVLLISFGVVLCGNIFGNHGPVIFSQVRVGKDGRDFRIYKFRTMSVDPADSKRWTTEGDTRITPFGRWLRLTHVDELPQIWNIIAGDLSLVGPRPEQREYVEELISKIPYFDVRHLVRPGLTGWAQVKYPYGANEADAREKLQYDLYYLRRQSLLLDLRIVVRTLRSVVGRAGR